MASITVRNLPDEVHRALKARAAKNGRSMQAEVRDILEQAVKPKDRLRVGSALAAFAQKHKLDLQLTRDEETTRIPDFE